MGFSGVKVVGKVGFSADYNRDVKITGRSLEFTIRSVILYTPALKAEEDC
jgi:hypothetical protein